ncbi:hypothetical protein T265_14103 [Opisthorchis viverrini]|uniref:Uncharacterized protein n=1 Tax=Opisthorchis viverrini TaxID=6198 RepID=A0A075ADA5_OPIVI|nr:hypothetical protein T265_14103 [Opisthorchis viverrini]KER25944.1 hypothetical protein T265_14103 [Opisthorchis viverrini]
MNANVQDTADTSALVVPLTAFGCALSVFLIFLLIIVLDTMCRNRKLASAKYAGSKMFSMKPSSDIIPAESTEFVPSTSEEEETTEPQQPRVLSDVIIDQLEVAGANTGQYCVETTLDYGYEGEEDSVTESSRPGAKRPSAAFE